ncbi:MAG TPA: UDP binding domain-containing protein [Candidatus Microsaccharimonas sp.]|nr:UDP binding domain-containing protein [Candidatus Microsaccharimonas sp.]
MNNSGSIETITVLGAGYVGLTTAALFAHAGYTVYLVEPNEQRLQTIRSGKSFFFEEGLDPIIEHAVAQKTLIPTDSYETCIAESQIVFSCVGTPDNPDGSSNLSYIFAAAKATAQHAKSDLIYVQKSTVPVGTGAKLQTLFQELGASIQYVSNPEFLREGMALYDTLFFDRVVVGSTDTAANEKVLDVYRHVEAIRPAMIELSGVRTDRPANTSVDLARRSTESASKYLTTQTLESAELVKVTSNAFLALKISFANSIAVLADRTGGDFREIVQAVGADPRIGSLLCNGRGYGGGCFPKDVSGLIASGLDNGVELDIVQATQRVNSAMPGYIVEKLLSAFAGDMTGKKVAVLGLSFKVGTSDARKSPGVAIANLLVRAGATVFAYDPEARQEADEILVSEVTVTKTMAEAIAQADAVLITTGWPEFITHGASEYAQQLQGAKILFDTTNSYDREPVRATDLQYMAVGGKL